MQQEDLNSLTYRKGVIVIIINKNKEYLMIQKSIYDIHEWDFAGGGIEDNESIEEATLRELNEELGTKEFKIMKISKYKDTYEWPNNIVESVLKDKGETWKGQSRTPVVVLFTGTKNDIKLEDKTGKKAWVSDYKWVQEREIQNYLNFSNQISLINALKEEYQIQEVSELVQ